MIDVNTCYCCKEELNRAKLEKHHFPIPKRLGGERTIPLCRICHDFVDRHKLEDWPWDMWKQAFREQSRVMNLLMLKYAKIVQMEQ